VLGGLSVATADGRDLSGLLAQPKRLALFIYLASEPRRFHRRDALLPIFWSEADDAHARTALRNAVYFLRNYLGAGAIVGRGSQEIAVGEDVWSDMSELACLSGAARAEEALALYTGDMLPGFFLSDAPEFERWLESERNRLRSIAVSTAWQLAEECERAHRIGDAIRAARRAADIDPTDEQSSRRLIALLDRCGDRGAALAAYDELRRRLQSEYDVNPAPETEQLVARIRARRPSTTSSVREADVAYERGTYLFLRAAHGGHSTDLAQSRAFFEEAIARAPDFAPAYAGLSNYFAVSSVRGDLRPFEEHFARAIELSHHALTLDPQLAIPHVHFGVKAMYLDYDWETALREFRLATSLDPAYAEGHRFYGTCLGALGRQKEALAEFREAARLEPQIPLYANAVAAAHIANGDFESAIIELQRALKIDAAYGAARDRLIRCYESLALFADAIGERKRVSDEKSAAFERAYVADGDAGYRRERASELRASIAAMISQRDSAKPRTGAEVMNPVEVRLAIAHAELGEREDALRWVEAACAGKPGRFPWFSSRRELELLHSDPRWNAMRAAFAARARKS
jgi:DNA-binding SARP family transcriptional activator